MTLEHIRIFSDPQDPHIPIGDPHHGTTPNTPVGPRDEETARQADAVQTDALAQSGPASQTDTGIFTSPTSFALPEAQRVSQAIEALDAEFRGGTRQAEGPYGTTGDENPSITVEAFSKLLRCIPRQDWLYGHRLAERQTETEGKWVCDQPETGQPGAAEAAPE